MNTRLPDEAEKEVPCLLFCSHPASKRPFHGVVTAMFFTFLRFPLEMSLFKMAPTHSGEEPLVLLEQEGFGRDSERNRGPGQLLPGVGHGAVGCGCDVIDLTMYILYGVFQQKDAGNKVKYGLIDKNPVPEARRNQACVCPGPWFSAC